MIGRRRKAVARLEMGKHAINGGEKSLGLYAQEELIAAGRLIRDPSGDELEIIEKIFVQSVIGRIKKSSCTPGGVKSLIEPRLPPSKSF